MSLRDRIEQAILQNVAHAQYQNKIKREAAEQFTPSAGQVAWGASLLAPGAGIYDAQGNFPSAPTYEQPVAEAWSNEPMASMAENWDRGGLGGYFDASMQGLGVAGDAVLAAPFVGPVLGTGLKGIGALGAVAKAAATGSKAGKTGKGITALDETKRMLQADVNTFAKDDLGFTSPTMEALITKAPANLKGKQIIEWAQANANKGVKPKELEFLGLDEFVAANPNATMREVVAGVSANKVRVSKNIKGGGEGQVMDFDISTPLEDPLDGSLVYQHTIDDIKYDLENMTPADEYIKDELLQTFKEANPAIPASNLNEVETFLKSKGESLDDLVDVVAKNRYMQDPYELIKPTGVNVGGKTFAFGNDDVGYELFVNGERVSDKNNIAYSQTEAQIQLRNAMADRGEGTFRIDADDFDESMDYLGGEAKYKQFIDDSLPGGSNYQEVVFNWDNAPVKHDGFAHFDDDNQIAHALTRDRVLADGTDTKHIDELQSDLHTKGSQDGYKTKESIEELNKQHTRLKSKIENSYEELKPIIEKYRLTKGFKNEPRFNFHPPDEASLQKQPQSLFDLDDYINDMVREYTQREKIGPSQLPKDLNDALLKLQDPVDEFKALNRAHGKKVPNYPFKDDYHVMVLKNMLLDAIEEGKPALSVSGSAPIKARYSEKYHKFYEMLYDKKIPSAMKKLSNKYGGKFEVGS